MYKAGNKIKAITKPDDFEFTFRIGEILVIESVVDIGSGFYRFKNRGAIKACNVIIIPTTNIIGGQLL